LWLDAEEEGITLAREIVIIRGLLDSIFFLNELEPSSIYIEDHDLSGEESGLVNGNQPAHIASPINRSPSFFSKAPSSIQIFIITSPFLLKSGQSFPYCKM
jgi:hypothetical protein